METKQIGKNKLLEVIITDEALYSDVDLLKNLTGCCKAINSTFEMEKSSTTSETTETTRQMEPLSS